MNTYKTCTKCKEEKPISDFHHDKSKKDGLTSWCKVCIKTASQIRYQDPEVRQSIKLQIKKYRQDPEVRKGISLRMKDYYQNSQNKERIKIQQKEYRQTPEGRETSNLWQQKYNQTPEGKETRRLGQQKYLRTAKGKAADARKRHKRRALKGNSISDLTAEQWEEIKINQDYKCAICGEKKPLHRDHIIPVSKGGTFTKSNIQGLCANCNSRKSNKIWVTEEIDEESVLLTQ
jgi:5-methylcytosine-specific restriction endonuclease McrA